MAHGMRMILALCILVTLVYLSLAKMYDIGEEPTSCPVIPELPTPFEGWEFLTCKNNIWLWASLNASGFYDHDMACDDRHGTFYGRQLVNQSFYYIIGEHFLDSNTHGIGDAVQILRKLTPKRRIWYAPTISESEEPCNNYRTCRNCFTIGWSEEKKDFDKEVPTDCNEEHYAICFGVLESWDMY